VGDRPPGTADVLGFIAEHDFGDLDPGVYGAITIRTVEGGDSLVSYQAVVRPGTDLGVRLTFAEWAAERFARFAEHGPEPDGWLCRDGAAQLLARMVNLPE
jgi:hypothetical protein